MAIVQVKDATGSVLDWMVAKCQGFESLDSDMWLVRDGISDMPLHAYTPSSDWSQGGPIIEQEKIELIPPANESILEWVAVWYKGEDAGMQGGTSPLIAAMRCFCCSKLGDIVDVPEELCQ